MPSTTGSFTTHDGLRLHLRRWSPAGEPWARVQLVHGLGEHAGRWEPIGDVLAAAGLEIVAADLRGFGRSEGPRADLDRWERYLDDADELLAVLRVAEPPRPVVLYGHSLGAIVALGHVLSGRPTADLLVLTGPAIDDDLAGWKHALAPLLARVVPTLRMPNGVGAVDLASHPRPGFVYEADPLVLRSSTARFGAMGFAEQARLRAELERRAALPVPSLVLRGADDPIVPARVMPRFERLGNVTVRTYAGLRHEIHNEANGDEVVGEVIAWLRERVSPRV